MELTITNDSKEIKLECKYNLYTYYLSERPHEKIIYLFTKIRNADKKIISTNDNNIDLPTYRKIYRSSKICKRIYYHIININKLSDGKIREYEIFNKFELDVLCNYLLNKNIVYQIVVKDYKSNIFMVKIKKFTCNSEEYQKSIKEYIEWVNDFSISRLDFVLQNLNDFSISRLDFVLQNLNDPETNKVFHWCKIYVRVYKGFIDLCKSKNDYKYGIYIFE